MHCQAEISPPIKNDHRQLPESHCALISGESTRDGTRKEKSKQGDARSGRVSAHYARGQVGIMCQSMGKGGQQRPAHTVITEC